MGPRATPVPCGVECKVNAGIDGEAGYRPRSAACLIRCTRNELPQVPERRGRFLRACYGQRPQARGQKRMTVRAFGRALQSKLRIFYAHGRYDEACREMRLVVSISSHALDVPPDDVDRMSSVICVRGHLLRYVLARPQHR